MKNLFQNFTIINKGSSIPFIPEIAFVGRSNVGKSSLINSILNHNNLANVSNTPGSTIKIKYFNLGNKLLLIDMPGYGYIKRSKTTAEKINQDATKHFSKRSQMIMLFVVIDARRGIKQSDLDAIDFIKPKKSLFIFNKIDKLTKSSINNLKEKNSIITSCKNSEGIRSLRGIIYSCYKNSSI